MSVVSRRSLFAALSAASAVATLALTASRRARGPSRPARVSLGVSALRISLPLCVAAAHGLFARHGLEVDLQPYPTAQPLIDDLALGRLDAGGFAAWPILFLAAARSPGPLHVGPAVVEDRDHRLSYVLARRGAGLRFPRDAAGRRVGVLPTVAYRRWLAAILRAAGIDPARVATIPVAPAMQAQALAAGAVDFLFTNDPMATAMLRRGRAELADDGPPCALHLGTPFSFGSFALSDRFVRREPDRARRLVAAVDEAIALARRDPRAGREALGAYLRPDEAPYVEHYPDTRYVPSNEAAGVLPAAIAQARRLGLIDQAPNVTAIRGFA